MSALNCWHQPSGQYIYGHAETNDTVHEQALNYLETSILITYLYFNLHAFLFGQVEVGR